MRGFARLLGLAVVATGFLILAPSARAQSGFNIDLDDPFSPPQGGGGAPSSAFGAAANQVGFWNALNDADTPPTQLYDLSDHLTNVTVTGPSSGIGGGWNFSGNTGDYALLLNDGHQTSHDSWTFTNVPSRLYDIYTYSVFPDANLGYTSTVTVSGSVTQNPQYVTGPMPDNRFILGVTHSIHEINVTSGSFTIQVDFNGSHAAIVNGFQIVAVPEPSLIFALSTGIVSFVVARPSASRKA